MDRCILVRYGEVFLKKGNRPRFLKSLRINLQQSLDLQTAPGRFRVHGFHGRYEVIGCEPDITPAGWARALEAVACTFGIVSASPALKVEPTYETIEQVAFDLVTAELEKRSVAHFKVEASRADKRFPMTSPEIGRRVGARIHMHHKLPARMTNPELTVGIEIYPDCAYVHAASVRGPGGLPVGSSGRAVLLLSGGIDSPVAGWMMAKRGCRLTAVHFHSYPYTSKRSQEKVQALLERLVSYCGPVRLLTIPLSPIQEFLRDRVAPDSLVLFYRRSMVRLAARVAEREHAGALVTGESLGQVASQTTANIAVIEDASPVPLFRPLIGMDKVDAVDLARRIGTYAVSIEPHDDCCSLFLPQHPETRGSVEVIRKLEGELTELPALEDAAFAAAEESWPGTPPDRIPVKRRG
jgi:thiamine biosynthesis protein ThiI